MTLRQHLEATLSKLNTQQDMIERMAEQRGIGPHEMLGRDGKWVMVEVLVAKANVLNALVTLEATERIKSETLYSRTDPSL